VVRDASVGEAGGDPDAVAFKVDGPRAAFPFAVDYRGFGPAPMVPPSPLP